MAKERSNTGFECPLAVSGEEPRKPMRCWNCPRYNRAERICLDGKANPRSKSDSVAVAETLGLRTLCHYNLFRDALSARMHYPRARIGILSVTPSRKRGSRRSTKILPAPIDLPASE